MSEHNPEPWRLDEDVSFDCATLFDRDGGFIAGYDLGDPNFRRIVACVNACRGLPTAFLEHHTMHYLPGFVGLVAAKEALASTEE